MEQHNLFVESLEEALADAVKALRGPKAVGVLLWPEMSADLAAKRLNHCLDPERQEKLDLSQVVLISKRARAVGCHTVMGFLAQALDYEFKPVDPETTIQREKRELTDALRQATQLMARLEKREAEHLAQAGLRRVA